MDQVKSVITLRSDIIIERPILDPREIEVTSESKEGVDEPLPTTISSSIEKDKRI